MLAQPFWYWALVFVLLVTARAYIKALVRGRRYQAICDAAKARAAEDFYWRFYRNSELQLAATITAHKYSDRLLELLNENEQRRETRLRIVSN